MLVKGEMLIVWPSGQIETLRRIDSGESILVLARGVMRSDPNVETSASQDEHSFRRVNVAIASLDEIQTLFFHVNTPVEMVKRVVDEVIASAEKRSSAR